MIYRIMEQVYITDNIILNDGILFFNDNQKLVKMKTSNVSNYISDLGWDGLDDDWNNLLINHSKYKNIPYMVLECGGDGDCLFHCIAEAFNNVLQFPDNLIEPKYSMEQLRQIAIDQINIDNYELILDSYKTAYQTNEMMDTWDPTIINNIEDLKNILKLCWGDHIILQLLQQALEVNIVVFNNYIFSNSGNNISSMGQSITKYPKTILLYYIDNIHFQLIGKFNGKTIQTIFYKLPIEIKNLVNH